MTVDRVSIVTGETGPMRGDEPDMKVEQEAPYQSEPEQPSEDATNRPNWLPEKFSSPEDMAKAYSELEKKLGGKQEQEGTEQPPEPKVSPEAIKSYSEEFLRDGKLSDQSYAELASLGVDRSLVDAYVAGQQALVERQAETIYSTVGGREAYGRMVSWASENLSKDEISAFNDVVATGDLKQINLAVAGINSRMKSATHSPSLIQGKSAGKSASGAFRSTAELVAAMRDPRYQADPAYRADIETRLSISDIL
jgi:hypothetical protein